MEVSWQYAWARFEAMLGFPFMSSRKERQIFWWKTRSSSSEVTPRGFRKKTPEFKHRKWLGRHIEKKTVRGKQRETAGLTFLDTAEHHGLERLNIFVLGGEADALFPEVLAQLVVGLDSRRNPLDIRENKLRPAGLLPLSGAVGVQDEPGHAIHDARLDPLALTRPTLGGGRHFPPGFLQIFSAVNSAPSSLFGRETERGGGS